MREFMMSLADHQECGCLPSRPYTEETRSNCTTYVEHVFSS